MPKRAPTTTPPTRRKAVTISLDHRLDAALRLQAAKMRPRTRLSDLIELACERYLEQLEADAGG